MEISVTDLRIGNLVQGRDGEIITVDSILDYGINIISGWYGDYEADHSMTWISGIPLTEEWLLRFGFKKSIMNSHIYFHDEFYSIYEFDSKFKYSPYEPCGYIDIKHVHQLQNLYFVLTNKELIWEK